jgi:hypothetical protein
MPASGRAALLATSTILVQYLRAVDIKITQRLATALVYGIKADTLGLERGGSKADLEAFAFVHMLANHNALRRIERPELSDVALDLLANGAKRQILKGVFFSHLGTVPTVDQIPLFADFGLQAEGVEWSVVSGVVGSDLHISVRNVGYVKSAGDVTRAAFGDLGSAGGHRTMAKAVVPVREIMKGAGDSPTGRASQERIIQRFLKALGHNTEAADGRGLPSGRGARRCRRALCDSEQQHGRDRFRRGRSKALSLVIPLSALVGIVLTALLGVVRHKLRSRYASSRTGSPAFLRWPLHPSVKTRRNVSARSKPGTPGSLVYDQEVRKRLATARGHAKDWPLDQGLTGLLRRGTAPGNSRRRLIVDAAGEEAGQASHKITFLPTTSSSTGSSTPAASRRSGSSISGGATMSSRSASAPA